MEYALIRSARKTIGLYIKDGVMEVRAPRKASLMEIHKFIASKEKWIAEKLAASQEHHKKKRDFTVSYGSMLLWRGVEYPLLGDSGITRLWRDEQGFHLPPGIDDDNLKHNVIRLYKICAKNYLLDRVRHYAKVMGVLPSDVKVTEAKTRWGSCSKRMPQRNDQAAINDPIYNVNFSWRLCMAGDDVIDAVVVHELAHIKEMNHSPAFYAEVKSVLPDYDERNAKLILLSKRLGCEDWEM
jgi:predicted metal-dependent hydrolase